MPTKLAELAQTIVDSALCGGGTWFFIENLAVGRIF